jgi:hypothetical protein
MGSSGFTALDLDETFSANRMVATSGAVYVGGIILSSSCCQQRVLLSANSTNQKTDRTLNSATIHLSFRSSGFFQSTGAFGPLGRLRVLCSCDRLRTVSIWKLLSCCKDLVVVPGVFVVFERTIKRCEPSGGDELGDHSLIPVLWAGVYALRDKSTVIDGLIVVAA